MLRGKLIGAAVVVLGAVLCSGCIAFVSPPTATQNGQIGSVHVSFSVCATQNGNSSPPPGSCTTSNGNSSSQAGTDQAQVWLGFRVPKGTVAPASFTSTATGPANTGPQLNFTQSADYTSELQRVDPAPAGMEWVGYASQYFSYNAKSGEQNFTAAPDFGLPKGAGGAPFQGPFNYRVVVGGRESNLAHPDPREPIDCQNSADGGGDGTSNAWICVDNPAPGTGPGQIDSNSSLPTRDAGIEPPGKRSSKGGKKVNVPFVFVYEGATGAGTFTFSASTSVHGASARPSVQTATPTSTSSQTVDVIVSIPKRAKPGNYVVTLTARLADGELRTGSATIHVARSPKRHRHRRHR